MPEPSPPRPSPHEGEEASIWGACSATGTADAPMSVKAA